MNAATLLLALALTPAAAQDGSAAGFGPVLGFGPKTGYGVLLLAYDVDAEWERELGSLRLGIKGHAVESAQCLNIDEAVDVLAMQSALDRFRGQRVGKIVGVPLETIDDSPRMQQTRYLFGVRQDPVSETPDPEKSSMRPLRPRTRSSLLLEPDVPRPHRLSSRVPLVLAPTLGSSPVLVDILADRAKALALAPKREAVVLAGIAPRSDDERKAWIEQARAIAEAVRAKAGFREAAVAALRDGVNSSQQDSDRRELRQTFRGLARSGAITVVPLSPSAARVKQLLDKNPPGPFYRWNGKGILGDARLLQWIKAAAAEAAKLPDGRKYKDSTMNTLGDLP
ncbi:MAG: hypothetical protein HKL90_11860 [Elusimicrobia bacterium]|nr:hypothetical protein [Elusimicrobiota bacterium]